MLPLSRTLAFSLLTLIESLNYCALPAPSIFISIFRFPVKQWSEQKIMDTFVCSIKKKCVTKSPISGSAKKTNISSSAFPWQNGHRSIQQKPNAENITVEKFNFTFGRDTYSFKISVKSHGTWFAYTADSPAN